MRMTRSSAPSKRCRSRADTHHGTSATDVQTSRALGAARRSAEPWSAVGQCQARSLLVNTHNILVQRDTGSPPA
jgi:hypothetical protein